MASACFGEAPYQRVVLCVEEQDAQIHARLPERVQGAWQELKRFSAARIDTDGDFFVAGFAQEIGCFGEQQDRQVVDAIVAAVFERLDGDAFARTGQAADEYELHHCRLAETRAAAQIPCVRCAPKRHSP